MGSNEEDIDSLKKRIAELQKEKEMMLIKNMYMERTLKKTNTIIDWTPIPPPTPPIVTVQSSTSGLTSHATELLDNLNNKLQSSDPSQKPQDISGAYEKDDATQQQEKIDDLEKSGAVQKTNLSNENLEPISPLSDGSIDNNNMSNQKKKNITFTVTPVADHSIQLHQLQSKVEMNVDLKTNQNANTNKRIAETLKQSNPKQKKSSNDSNPESTSSSSKNTNENVAAKIRGKNGGQLRRNWRSRGGYRGVSGHRVTYDGKVLSIFYENFNKNNSIKNAGNSNNEGKNNNKEKKMNLIGIKLK